MAQDTPRNIRKMINNFNNLRLNTSKSREMIIYRRKRFVPPPLITGMERVTIMKILTIVVGCELSATLHISDVADLVRAAEDRLLGAVVANSHNVPRPVFSIPMSGDLASGRDLMTSPCHSKDNNFISRVLHRSLQPQSTNNI